MSQQKFDATAGLFYCPITSAVHPKLADLAHRSSQWITDIGLCANKRQFKRLIATNSAEFYGRITPEGVEERLQVAVDWCYWGFAFDDLWSYDNLSAERSDDFLVLVGRLLRMLETLDPRLCHNDPYLTALHDIAIRISRYATPMQLRRWVESHRSWFVGVAQRNSFQSRKVMPSLDAYMIMRLHDCGGGPVTSMIEIANGIEVPAHEMDAPAVHAITEATWMIAALDNERVSCAKEVHGEGQSLNLIDVLIHERGYSFEQALHDVIAMRDRMMCLFLRLYQQTIHHGSAELATYIRDLGRVIRGNIEWSLNTARYTAVYTSETAPSGIVNVSSGWSSDPSDGRSEPLGLPSIDWWWAPIAKQSINHRVELT